MKERVGNNTSTVSQQSALRLIPPSQGLIMMNVDAALAKGSNRGAVSVICRDHQGVYYGSSAIVIGGISDVATLEAMAWCKTLASDLNLQKMHIASIVVTGINEGSLCHYSTIWKENSNRRRKFQHAIFVNEWRSSNTETHKLSRCSSSPWI